MADMDHWRSESKVAELEFKYSLIDKLKSSPDWRPAQRLLASRWPEEHFDSVTHAPVPMAGFPLPGQAALGQFLVNFSVNGEENGLKPRPGEFSIVDERTSEEKRANPNPWLTAPEPRE